MTADRPDATADGPAAHDEPAAHDDPFARLLRVQDLDTRLSQLHHRRATLAERTELNAVEAELARLGARVEELAEQRRSLMERQADLESQIGAVDSRRRTVEERMYGSRGSAARDLQAMDDEVRHLVRRRSELEEVELSVMEEQEPVDAELATLTVERDRVDDEARQRRATVEDAESVVDAEIRTAEAARGTEAAGLPTALADRYETLRARLKGTGAARLIGNRCDGCHLELPSVEVERIRRLPPTEVVTCDQCGRILVKAPPAAGAAGAGGGHGSGDGSGPR